MKIKFIAIACIMLSILQLSITIEASAQTSTANNFKYLPITDYQKSLMAFLCNFSGSCFDPTKNENIADKPTHSIPADSIPTHSIPTHSIPADSIPADIVKEIQEMSREEALEAIKLITSKIFDPSDPEHVGKHLLAMKDLTEYLDQEIDKKTVTAIHFLLANQHKSSAMDTAFWWHANNKYELSTAIPMTPEVAKNNSNATILRKKMAAQKIKLKEPSKEDLVVIPV